MAETERSLEAPEEKGGLRFPFYDLAASVEVARAIHERGGGSGSLDQLAAWLGHKGQSGSFLTKLASARVFGLITNTTNGIVRTTERGEHAVAPVFPGTDDRRALVEAFEAVPLFAAVLKTYKVQLPPPDGLETAFQKREFGLSKQAAVYARRSLIASARFAGYFDARGGAPTHLIRPVIIGATVATSEERTETRHDEGAARRAADEGSHDRVIHRAVRGAVDMLPEPGTTLTADQLKGLVDAYRTALTIAYPVKAEDVV